MTSISTHEKDPRSSASIGGLFSSLGVLGAWRLSIVFPSKWKVEAKIDGKNFPLGRLGDAKIVGKIALELSREWNFLSTPKNSQWKVMEKQNAETSRQDRQENTEQQQGLQRQFWPQMNADEETTA